MTQFTNHDNQELISCDANINHRCDIFFWLNFYVDRSNFFLTQIYNINNRDPTATILFVKSVMFKKIFEHKNLDQIESSDFENESFTNLISFNSFQSSQISNVINVNHNSKQISANDNLFIFISDTSFMFINKTSLTFTNDASHISTITAQNAEFDQRNLDMWFQSQSASFNDTFVVTQKIYKNKQIEKTQARFTKTFRFHLKKSSLLNIEQLKTEMFKQWIIIKYLNLQNQKNVKDHRYLILKNCVNEHFSFYRYALEHIDAFFEFLNTNFKYFVMSIKQNDRYEYSRNQSTSKKKLKVSSMFTIVNKKSYCVLIIKINTKVFFEMNKAERIQSSQQ